MIIHNAGLLSIHAKIFYEWFIKNLNQSREIVLLNTTKIKGYGYYEEACCLQKTELSTMKTHKWYFVVYYFAKQESKKYVLGPEEAMIGNIRDCDPKEAGIKLAKFINEKYKKWKNKA